MQRPEMKMVVGLGNPGPEFVDTRHNAGFRVVDALAEALKISVKEKKFGGLFGQGEFEDKELMLLKPTQFMNRSGQAVAAAVGFHELSLPDLLVISDDIALEPGRIRLRAGGSAGGHKGLADILEKLGTERVSRLRIGIGPCGAEDATDYVLDEPTAEEKPLLNEAVDRAVQAALCWLRRGIEAAMNSFNSEVLDKNE
ncbi:MAG: aminoacyl-tRNA hydrolase [Planctomycetota bacterium]|jgi:PTH1 family peptidyl-tRNA hydrolase